MANCDEIWSEHEYYRTDPLPDIAPALLNSLDVGRYVEKGCLIEKANFERKRRKLASYKMRFLGDLYDWCETDGGLQKRSRKICDGEFITLHKNSISFLRMQEKLLLPEYIAARFNLHIKHVHKGILLGTGPLIDPGFGGRLLIPLHNLTDNDYQIEGGDGIIWVEFTKLSTNPYWSLSGDDTERPDELIPFPAKKAVDSPNQYFSKSGVIGAGGVQSAFKGALERTRRDAKAAIRASDDARRSMRVLTIGGVLGGSLGIAALLISAYQLSFPVIQAVHSQSDRITELEQRLENIAEETALESPQMVDTSETPAELEESSDTEVEQ